MTYIIILIILDIFSLFDIKELIKNSYLSSQMIKENKRLLLSLD